MHVMGAVAHLLKICAIPSSWVRANERNETKLGPKLLYKRRNLKSYHTWAVTGVLGKHPKFRALGLKVWLQHEHVVLCMASWKVPCSP